ncbi:HlyD family efflux transporter periplasmic adaptor subunit [Acetobacterium sp.]|uniref:HlyD family efflux transporter periplasmic adaptor subunit n=1 Tax=Acetobacterium sp. TaxID=1872094 RepID=UPI002715B8FC|nr:HlyD family efflux transporter periplasmic adaptor subunit [Acetobacterium sp.]MDO9491826.1 biotin/lipoyl-binding protein [Acetobacterium sp.]
MSKSIFKNKEDKSTKKSEHAALMTVIGPGNLLILLGIIIFLVGVIIYSITVPINITTTMDAVVSYGEGTAQVVVENEGILSQLSVSNGDYVKRGDLLGVLTTEGTAAQIIGGAVLTDQEKSLVKRQTMIVAMESGMVADLSFQDGAFLPKNSTLCQIVKRENEETTVVVLAYSSYEQAINVKQGDRAFVAVESAATDEYGYLRGIVRSVQLSGLSQEEESPVEMQIIIDLKVDDQGNYIWTKENNGFSGEITAGTSASATIFTDQLYLIDLIIS